MVQAGTIADAAAAAAAAIAVATAKGNRRCSNRSGS